MAKQNILLSGFSGIAPRYGDQVKPGMAVVAQDCDLTRGKLGPRMSDVLVESHAGGYNSIVKFGDVWVYGNDAFFLQWKITDKDLLIYLDGMTPKRRIGTAVVDLGQPQPEPVSYMSVVTQNLVLSDITTYAWVKSATNDELYCTLPGGLNPSLLLPDNIYINGAAATRGTVGSLNFGEWGYGNNDSLGFSTVYAKIPMPSAYGRYKWQASYYTDCYYLVEETGSIPALVDNPWWVMIGEMTLTAGSIGALGYNQFAYGDIDSIGHTALYIKFSTTPKFPGYVVVTDGLGHAVGYTLTDDIDDPGSSSVSSVTYESGKGNLTGYYRYIVTVTREVEGYQDESGPSLPSWEAVLQDAQLQVTRPLITEPYAAYWNLYRISSNTGVFQLVAQIPITQLNYIDNTIDADLGIAIPTSYTSSLGNSIVFAKPPYGFQGIASDIHSGMIFAWSESDLYFSEPGVPDAWPEIYTINFASNIKQVIPFAGSVAVLCETGPYRIDGTNPEQLQQSKPLGREPCITNAACATNKGVLYLSDTGLVLFNLVDTQVFSLGAFTEDWFADNIAPATVKICASHDTAYLVHTGGVLLYNATKDQWTTLDLIAEAVYVNPEDGDVYALVTGEGIKRLFDGDSFIDFIWTSGQLKGKDPEKDKLWLKVRGKGSGVVTIASSVDDKPVSTKVVDLDAILERDSRVNLPSSANGKALKLALSGSGSVEELIVEYEI